MKNTKFFGVVLGFILASQAWGQSPAISMSLTITSSMGTAGTNSVTLNLETTATQPVTSLVVWAWTPLGYWSHYEISGAENLPLVVSTLKKTLTFHPDQIYGQFDEKQQVFFQAQGVTKVEGKPQVWTSDIVSWQQPTPVGGMAAAPKMAAAPGTTPKNKGETETADILRDWGVLVRLQSVSQHVAHENTILQTADLLSYQKITNYLITDILNLRIKIKKIAADKKNNLSPEARKKIQTALAEDRSLEYLENVKEALQVDDKVLLGYGLERATLSAFTSIGVALYEISVSFDELVDVHQSEPVGVHERLGEVLNPQTRLWTES